MYKRVLPPGSQQKLLQTRCTAKHCYFPHREHFWTRHLRVYLAPAVLHQQKPEIAQCVSVETQKTQLCRCGPGRARGEGETVAGFRTLRGNPANRPFLDPPKNVANLWCRYNGRCNGRYNGHVLWAGVPSMAC